MNPIIKWPGGKSRELEKILPLIPAYDRYVEPFFGGGALYFHLQPEKAAINDISRDLTRFYALVKRQDPRLKAYLEDYDRSFQHLMQVCKDEYCELLHLFFRFKTGVLDEDGLQAVLASLLTKLVPQIDAGFQTDLVLSREELYDHLLRFAQDKLVRTVANYDKAPYSTEDLCENLLTGFTSGYYMYFRKVFNDWQLGRNQELTESYRMANFYFIREYCYGSMFRYNARGEFNIPYGGMSYNRKDMGGKVAQIFSPELAQLFAGAHIACQDFEHFLQDIQLTDRDFLFLDPPYDTDFSDYEGKDFSRFDQERLANFLKATPARFILIIKNTDFIYSLYEKDFHILSFDKQYSYNVRSRNARGAEHLIVTNF